MEPVKSVAINVLHAKMLKPVLPVFKTLTDYLHQNVDVKTDIGTMEQLSVLCVDMLA